MANSNNVFTTAQPLQNTVSDWINDQERMGFAKRQEDREIEEINLRRQEREQAKKDLLRKEVLSKIPKNYDTGSSSLNEFQGRLILQGVNRKGEIAKKLSDPSLSDDERIKLEIENQNIDNLPENLQLATNNFSKVIADYRQGVLDGTYFPNPDFEKKTMSGFENYVGGLDNGLPVVGFIDRDGDGVMDVLPYENLAQGLGPNDSAMPWKFQKQFDLDKLAVATGEKLGKVENTTEKGYTSYYTKGADLKSLNTVAKNLMQKPDGTPTDVALSELRKRGLAVTPENLKVVEDAFKDKALAYVDRAYKEETDFGAINSANRERRLGRKSSDQQFSIYDLSHATDTNAQSTTTTRDKEGNVISTKSNPKQIVSNNYTGDVNIERKVGRETEVFRNFGRDKKGSLIVTVDVASPKYSAAQIAKLTENIEDEDEKQARIEELSAENGSIKSKKYSSEGNAGQVFEFVKRFNNKDGAPYRTIKEFTKDLPEFKEGKKQETAAERALRIANGG